MRTAPDLHELLARLVCQSVCRAESREAESFVIDSRCVLPMAE